MNEVFADEVEEAVGLAIAAACNLEQAGVTREASMLELGVDSMTLIGIVVQLQARLGIHIGPDELAQLFDAPSVGEFIAIVRRAPADEPI